MSRPSNAQVLPLLKKAPEPHLIFLNGLTEHWFSSLYRFDADTLKNLYFYDRENPTLESSPDVPVIASYDEGKTGITQIGVKLSQLPSKIKINQQQCLKIVQPLQKLFEVS